MARGEGKALGVCQYLPDGLSCELRGAAPDGLLPLGAMRDSLATALEQKNLELKWIRIIQAFDY